QTHRRVHPNRLVIIIDCKPAPRASDLGELFTALARDYKDVTEGRVLVVTSIQRGSIIATLTDWALQAFPIVNAGVEGVLAAKALADFWDLLRAWINGANAEKPKKPLYRSGRKAPGQRSVEAVVKIAAESGRDVRVKYT